MCMCVCMYVCMNWEMRYVCLHAGRTRVRSPIQHSLHRQPVCMCEGVVSRVVSRHTHHLGRCSDAYLLCRAPMPHTFVFAYACACLCVQVPEDIRTVSPKIRPLTRSSPLTPPRGKWRTHRVAAHSIDHVGRREHRHPRPRQRVDGPHIRDHPVCI